MDNQIPYSPSRLESTHYFLKRLPKYLSSTKNIIDVGCGRLYFLDVLEKLKFKGDYLGIDLEPKKPKKLVFSRNVKIQKKDILNFKTNKKFEMVACLWTLEHIKNDRSALTQMSNLLKPQGIFIIAVPSIWSWPFEFGRHGYHYYSKSQIHRILKRTGFRRIGEYDAGGLLGFLFMIGYSWPRYLILVPALFLYLMLKFFGLSQKSWRDFSNKLVSKIFYFYHSSKKGVAFHNMIITKIINLDNKFKILPASYIFVMTK